MNKQNKKIVIKRIRVEKLFGLYDYDIPREDEDKDIDTILILYGNNGSGKTTILRLVFHLLACESREGHKSFVGQTKFRSIKIEFTNGHEIWATRKGDSLIGSFEMRLIARGKISDKITFAVDPDNAVRIHSPDEDKEQNKFLRTIASQNLSLYLLSDDRTVQISSPRMPKGRRYRRHLDRESFFYESREMPSPRVVGEPEELSPEQISIWLVRQSIESAREWIQYQAMQGSSRGESDVNQLYYKIIERIASVPRTGRSENGITIGELKERIAEIDRRNKDFSKFGLTSPFSGAKLLRPMEAVKENQLPTLSRIIGPYLDSKEARLKALSNIQERISTLVSTINSFLVDKTVSFRVTTGFKIKSRNGEKLSPSTLSSGERHLFLLFCNAITALDNQSIFIIDEPEISLNVKWQRILIASLLDCVKNSPVQYIFATHSIELLSQHKDKVVKLESKNQ